ncbi:hypothetical protein J4416_04065 [Candidatus Pacearchaeota archaeon]|nr:hypothetical protein [Candidatus Pacearchaeota archaeon]
MILKMTPVNLADVKELSGDLDSKPELRDYLKEFSKLDKKKADSLMKDLEAIGNPKIREEMVVKIIDLLPRDSESVSKIFVETSLDEKELNEILAVVKEY